MANGLTYSEHDRTLIRAELARILASERFVNANRLSHLLRYVVEEALAGRRERLKAFTIAQDVFGRDAHFDQQRDSVVRVEASRLRKCLAQYYESSGVDSVLRIDIPKGSYAPTFTQREQRTNRAWQWTPKRGYLVIGLTILTVLATLWFVWRIPGPNPKQEAEESSAFLAVLPLKYDTDDIRAARLADSFVDSTITLLARLPDLSVMAHASVLEINGEQVRLQRLREEFGITHALRGRIATQLDQLRINIQLIDTHTLETIWSDQLEGNTNSVWEMQDELAANLLAALSIKLKAIEKQYRLIRDTDSAEALTLYRQGLFMILPPNETKRVMAARQLFGRVREIDPEFAGAYAGEAWSYALPVLFQSAHTPDDDLAHAIGLAKQAIQVNPGFGAGYSVLGFTEALAGQNLKALENTRLGAAMQPGDAFVQFLRAATLILSGIPEEAFAPLDKAIRLNPVERRAPYLNVYGIGRFANRDYQLALDLIARNQTRGGPHGPHMEVFRAAAHALMGELKVASAIIGQLNVSAPDFPYAAWLESWLGRTEHFDLTLRLLSEHGLNIPAKYLRRNQTENS